MLAYTGAGISTSAKIPDYRGPKGLWTLHDKGEKVVMDITIEQALPTNAHMALVELERQSILKFLVSTNVDGLHRRAGTSGPKMAELHGNCYKETCRDCKKEYLRTFDVNGSHGHVTGRKCDACGGALIDTIINFGENLPQKDVQDTILHAAQSDLSLVLGTSMRVSPANQFPLEALKNKGNLVIVNLQKTPYDAYASILIHARTDEVMELLMKELNIQIPTYNPSNDFIQKLKEEEEK